MLTVMIILYIFLVFNVFAVLTIIVSHSVYHYSGVLKGCLDVKTVNLMQGPKPRVTTICPEY